MPQMHNAHKAMRTRLYQDRGLGGGVGGVSDSRVLRKGPCIPAERGVPVLHSSPTTSPLVP